MLKYVKIATNVTEIADVRLFKKTSFGTKWAVIITTKIFGKS